MKIVAISGIIGLDVLPENIRAQLDAASGEPVEVQVSSPGGLVAEGLEIYNLIRRYPGPKSTRLMGQAASMASYIVLAGDRVIAEDNAIFMVHNARGIAFGDHRAMRKAADVMDGFCSLLARAYVRKSGKSTEAVREMMDAETYLYGPEIKDAGFADEVEPAGEGAENRTEAVALARTAMDRCDQRLKETQDAAAGLDKAAALLGEIGKAEGQPAGVAGDKTAAKADGISKTGGAKQMTLEELKKDHPDLYAAVAKTEREAGKVEGVAEGVAQERERLEQLNAFRGINADGDKAVDAAIRDGKAYAEVAPLIAAATAKGKSPSADGDNPADVATAAQGAAGGVQFTPELLRMGAQMGVTAEDIKKYGGVAQGGK